MHLLLDLDPDSHPVCGHVGLADAVPRSFTGYAELIGAVESIRTGESERDDARSEEVPS